MDDECPHGMGDPAWCVLCNGRAERESRNDVERMLTAKYRGRCPWCADPIEVGWRIGETTRGQYICGPCAVAHHRPRT